MIDIITECSELEQPSEPLIFINESGITKDEGNAIIDQLKKCFEKRPNLVCLAAPQIGIHKRIFGIKFNDALKFFINPVITKKRDLKIIFETNDSFPGKQFVIARPAEMSVTYYTEDYKYEDNKFLDAAAAIFDKMYQMLDGDLPTELGLVSDIALDGNLEDLSCAEMQEVVSCYKEFIKAKQASLERTMSNDDKVIYKNLKFSESVINGRTCVLENEPKQAANLNREQRRALTKAIKNKKNKNKRV